MKKQISIEIISLLFIILFVYAAVNKLMDVEKFQVQIGRSPLLTPFAPILALAIPSIEVIISLLIAIPRYRLIGLYAAFGLMIMFTGYIVAILNFSDDIPCSCGGVLEKLGWTEHLIFNIGFVVLAAIGILFMAKQKPQTTVVA